MDAVSPQRSSSGLDDFLEVLVSRWQILFATMFVALAVAGGYLMLRNIEYDYTSTIQIGTYIDSEKNDLRPVYDAGVAKSLLGDVLGPAERARIGKSEGLTDEEVPVVNVVLPSAGASGGQAPSNYLIELVSETQQKDSDLVKRLHTAIATAFSAMNNRMVEVARIRVSNELAKAEEQVTSLKQVLAQLPAQRPVIEQDLARVNDLITRWERTQSSTLAAGAANNVGSLDTLVTGYVSLTQLENRRSTLERELKLDLPTQQQKLEVALVTAQSDVDRLKRISTIGFSAPTLLSVAVRSAHPVSRGAASILGAGLVIGLLLGLFLVLISDKAIDLYRSNIVGSKSSSGAKRAFAAKNETTT